MSWLSQFVKHNRDFAGNALKNLAPAAFLIPGIGPGAAALIGGAGSALGRGIQHGANLGNIVKQGASGAAIAYGGGQGMNALKSAFAPSSSAAGTLASQGAAGAAEAPGSFVLGVEGSGPGYAASAANAAGSGTPASTLSQLASGFGNGAKAFGSFAKANPTAIGMGLQGLGQIGSMGAENAYKKAQTDQLNHQNQMSDYELQMLKQRQAALAPLLAAFQGQAYRPAGNPYSTGTNPYSSANPYT